MNNLEDDKGRTHPGNKKILVMLLPFWDPQIPPLGISCIKTTLQEKGYSVKTADANIKKEFREIYGEYFNTIKKYIPGDKISNLYNIGPEVLRNHTMAHLVYENKQDYVDLVKKLLFHTFYCDIDKRLIETLIEIVARFFREFRDYFLEILEEEKPGVLGLSVYSGTLPASLLAFQLTKEKHPQIMTVMGGGIFSSELSPGSGNYDIFLKKAPYIDKVIVGEGELLFLKLLSHQLPGEQRVFTLKDIDNHHLDLSLVKAADFSDFDLQYYPQLASYTSRSCPFQCNFCTETIYWGKYRKKAPGQIVEEMITLYKTYGRQLFLMCDSLLNPVITDLANQCLKADTAVYWCGYLRVDKIVCDANNTFLWRRGGFYRARLGIESGSARILETMNKKIDLRQVRDSLSSLAAAGIKTTAMFVIGYPGENEADFQETLRLVEKSKDDIYEADCNPFWYLETGQVNSRQWNKENKLIPLFPGKEADMVVFQSYDLDRQPLRQERYNRVNRFIQHCAQLGIPNPYTLDEVFNADERWRKLHKNAVPSLINFQGVDHYTDECRNIKNLLSAKNTLLLDKQWEF